MPKYLDGAGLSHFWESIKPKLGGVTESDSGTVITSDDAANLPPLSLTIHGKSVQDGTPSPSSPVEIRSVSAPNLAPFFSTPFSDTSYWLEANSSYTQLDDGWARLTANRTASSSNGAYYLKPAAVDGLDASKTYTVLKEVRNVTSTYVSTRNYSLTFYAAGQFPVNSTVGKTYGNETVSNPISLYSDPLTPANVGAGNFARMRCYVYAGNYFQLDQRLSLYEGEYTGAYVPVGSIGLSLSDGTTAYIDLDGHALRSLPDGTEDVLVIDSEGNVTLTQRIGITTTATTDGISATVGTDAMSTTGDLSDGATVIYKLASEQTISLGTVDLPSLPSPSFSMHVDALATPTVDAEWFTEGGGKVIEAVSTRIAALEADVDSLQADVTELQGQVPEREVLYDTSTWTIIRYGRTVMVQVHGATATPSTSTALVTGILADCKPAYNCSATVLTSSGSSTQAARMAVYADTGNVYIVPAGYSSSASWYGTLTYIY